MGGKGGSKIEVSQYQMSIHLGLALEVDSVTAAYYGEKRYWSGKVTANTTVNVSNTGLFGGNKKEGGIQGNMTFLMGRSTQVLPDSFAQKLGYSSGSECPGFRGITSILHTGPAPSGASGWMWCSNSPYLKSMWYTVVSIPKALGAEYSRVNDLQTELDIAYDSDWKYRVVSAADGGAFGVPSQYIAKDYDDASWLVGKGGFGSGGPAAGLSVGTFIPSDEHGKSIWLRRRIMVSNSNLAPNLNVELYHDDGVALWWNGEQITTVPTSNVYRSTATIPSDRVLADNTVVMQIIDGLPTGSAGGASHIYAGLTIAPEENASETVDANPAHIIYEVLTDGQFGMGLDPATSIDIPSFTGAAKTLFDEALGLSMAWSSSTSAEDFINEVKDHINALLFPDPETGKMVLKLVRDDYSVDDLRVVNPDNAKVKAYSKKAWGDTINEIVVTWTNPASEAEETVTLQDNGNIAEQGEVVSDAKNYYGVRSSALAWRLASRELRVASSPLSSAELELDRSFWNLRPGDCIKLTWPEYGITELVMRVWKVSYGKRGSSSITATVTEDVFSLPVSAFVQPPSTEWVDPSKPPQPIANGKVVTLPAYAVGRVSGASLQGVAYPIAYAGILGADPNGDTPSFNLLAETVDATSSPVWVDRGTMVTSGYHRLSATLPAEASSTGVNLAQMSGALPVKGSFLFVGSGGDSETEMCLVSEIVSGSLTLMRGVLDTVPRAWPISTPVWVVSGDFLIADQTQQSEGATPDYKLLSNTSTGQLSQAQAPVLTGTLTDRMHAPNRPANVAVGGVKFGVYQQSDDTDVSTTFARRNRLTEETVVVPWGDPDVTPETGQTVEIEVSDTSGALIKTVTGIAGTTATVPVADIVVPADPDGFNVVDMAFFAKRGEFKSIQGHTVRVKFKGGFELTGTLPNVTIGVPYSSQLGTTGGASPFTWSIVTGSLPDGITLNTSSGLVSGTATETAATSFSVTIKAQDANGRYAESEFSGVILRDDVYRTMLLALSPAAYWRLDETSGLTCEDSSGLGRNASYFADASTITSPGLLSTSDNLGMDFPLQAINIKAGFDRPLPIDTSSSWTMVALIKPMGETSAGASSLMQLGTVTDSSSNVPEIGPSYPGGGKFTLRVMRSGVAQLFESPQYDFGTRLHVVLTHGAGMINLWINGVRTNTQSHSYSGNVGNAKFGHAVFSGTNYYPFFGKLDEVALFPAVLTDAQIADLYSAS